MSRRILLNTEKKTLMKQPYKRVIIISASIILTSFLIICAPLMAIGLEPVSAAFYIDNPYVYRFYIGWKVFEEKNMKLRLPKGWELTVQNDLYIIRDDHGLDWAYGISFRGEDSYPNFEDIAEKVCPARITPVSEEIIISDASMNGCFAEKRIVQQGTSTKEFYYIYLDDYSSDQKNGMRLLVPIDKAYEQHQREIVEAIVYSFAYMNLQKAD